MKSQEVLNYFSSLDSPFLLLVDVLQRVPCSTMNDVRLRHTQINTREQTYSDGSVRYFGNTLVQSAEFGNNKLNR